MRFTVTTTVEQPLETVFPVFGEAAFVESLAPPLLTIDVQQIGLGLGQDIELRLRLGRRSVAWNSRIVHEQRGDDEITFVDRSGAVKPWPLAHWEHHHGFRRAPGGGTVIVDAPRFTVRPAAMAPLAYPLLWLSFRMRRRGYRRWFAHQKSAPTMSSRRG